MRLGQVWSDRVKENDALVRLLCPVKTKQTCGNVEHPGDSIVDFMFFWSAKPRAPRAETAGDRDNETARANQVAVTTEDHGL